MIDKRAEFVKKWYGRGVNEEDPFDQFFSLWIALVIASARWHTLQNSEIRDQTDREKIIQYFEGHCGQVLSLLTPGTREVKDLAFREGSSYGNPILDSGNLDLRAKFKRFAEHWATGQRLDEDELIKTFGEIINKIRNNVFHGVKIYDDRDDVAVLKLINPILRDVLRRCEAGIVN